MSCLIYVVSPVHYLVPKQQTLHHHSSKHIKTKLTAFVNSLHVTKYIGGHVVILLWPTGVESEWHDRFSLLKRPVDIYLQTIARVYMAPEIFSQCHFQSPSQFSPNLWL
jgi:hypothetical protein